MKNQITVHEFRAEKAFLIFTRFDKPQRTNIVVVIDKLEKEYSRAKMCDVDEAKIGDCVGIQRLQDTTIQGHYDVFRYFSICTDV